MSVEQLTEQHLEFVSLTGGYTVLCQNATLLEITCHGSFYSLCTFFNALARIQKVLSEGVQL